MSDPFVVEGTEVLLASHIFSVERRSIRHGDERFTRDVAVHPGAVAVLAIDAEGRVGMIRQYRATIDDLIYEVPAGTQDVAGEDPLATAQRELVEEMGLEAGEWTFLGRFLNSPGWSTQVMSLYRARELHHVERAPAGPEERASTLHWFEPNELRELLRNSAAVDSTTAILLQMVFRDFFEQP